MRDSACALHASIVLVPLTSCVAFISFGTLQFRAGLFILCVKREIEFHRDESDVWFDKAREIFQIHFSILWILFSVTDMFKVYGKTSGVLLRNSGYFCEIENNSMKLGVWILLLFVFYHFLVWLRGVFFNNFVNGLMVS